MTENTDKSPQKSGKTPPHKRAGKSRSPEGKRAKAPGQTAPADETAAAPAGAAEASKSGASAPGAAMSGAKSLAPDPATITFGSNRPIMATPPKLPESSGLRFAGPSAGVLKASGPQPTSPKASGLTFTSAKPAPPAANSGATGKAAAKKPAADAARPAEPSKPEGPAPATRKPALTKPAIAPQASGRHFDKQRSASGFAVMMLVLTVLGGGLAFWLKLDNEAAVPQRAPAGQVAEAETAPIGTDAAVVLGPSVRAPESPGPLVAGPLARADLSAEEIGEIQQLLDRLGLNPGSQGGVLTAATTAAIRSYQEMAGLTADGEADKALLEELRSVAELYGS